MAFYHNGPRSPNNLFVYDFAGAKPTKLTESLSPEINPEHLVGSRLVRYKSFDGLDMAASRSGIAWKRRTICAR